MSTVCSKRRLNNFRPLLDANELIRYTLQITSNEKYFKPCYRALTEDIVHTSEDIFTKLWEANNIRVVQLEDAQWRCKLQTEALMKCKNMLALINIGYSIYHLRGNRVEYWGNLIFNTQQSIIKWRNADRKKYHTF